MRKTIICLSVLTGVSACGKKPESETLSEGPRSFASAPVQTWDDIGNLSEENAVIRPELKDIFCVHVYKLPLPSDFNQELSVLCEDGKPNAAFDLVDRYAGKVGDEPRSVKLSLLHGEDGFTEGTYVTVYRVPIAPKWVRSANIPAYMVSASNFDYVQLRGSVLEDLTPFVGGDLQFGKWRLAYHSDVQTPASSSFFNDRETELNSYQVEGGNPDIGIGAEHLLGENNPDFKAYNTTTITIGNADGGSTLITVIRLSVRNNGFPDLTEKVFSDIATSQATQVHDGLIAEYAAGNFPPL